MPNPVAVVTELVRVTRPGGRVGLLDFDLAATVIDHPDPATTEAVMQALGATARTPRAGRCLRRWLVDAGCTDVTSTARFVVPPVQFFLGVLTPALRLLRDTGTPAPALEAWAADLQSAAASQRVTYAALVFTACGTVTDHAEAATERTGA